MLTISKRWTGWQTGVHDTNLHFPVGFKMFILKSCKKKMLWPSQCGLNFHLQAKALPNTITNITNQITLPKVLSFPT